MSHRFNLKRLHDLKAHELRYCLQDIRFVRGLAFTYGGRGLPWHELLSHLIEKLTPLAAIEAVTERLLA